MRPGSWRGSIYRVLLFRSRFSVSKPLSQKHGSTFLPLHVADPTPYFGGFEVTPRTWSSRSQPAEGGLPAGGHTRKHGVETGSNGSCGHSGLTGVGNDRQPLEDQRGVAAHGIRGVVPIQKRQFCIGPEIRTQMFLMGLTSLG